MAIETIAISIDLRRPLNLPDDRSRWRCFGGASVCGACYLEAAINDTLAFAIVGVQRPARARWSVNGERPVLRRPSPHRSTHVSMQLLRG